MKAIATLLFVFIFAGIVTYVAAMAICTQVDIVIESARARQEACGIAIPKK